MTGPGFGQTRLFPPEPAPDPLLCWLWLANTLGAGSSHAGRVLDVFGGDVYKRQELRRRDGG